MNGRCKECDSTDAKIVIIDYNGTTEKEYWCPRCFHEEVIEE